MIRAVSAILAAAMLAACDQGPVVADPVLIGADAQRGRLAVRQYGCGACHTIAAVPGADGIVGPPLQDFRRQVYIAGVMANTPQNLVRWLMDPPEIDPRTAMPDLGVTPEAARDIAALLYGLDQ